MLAVMRKYERASEAAMAIFEDLIKGGNIVTGLAMGVGFALLAPVVKPFVRPLAKSAIKAGVAAYEQGRVAIAELSEQAGDMVAEARSEIEEEAAKGKGRKSSEGGKLSEVRHGGRSS
jgi:hypothetical protein